MKRNNLKKLIKSIIKETLKESVSMKTDSEFNDGVSGTIAAVNLEETGKPKYLSDLGLELSDSEKKTIVKVINSFSRGGHAVPDVENVMMFGHGYVVSLLEKAKELLSKKPEYAKDAAIVDGLIKKLSKTSLKETDEDTIPGKFVERGEVKLEGGMPEVEAKKIANYHWDIFGQQLGVNGIWHFMTRGGRFCCSVGYLNGKPAILSVTTTPGRLQLLVGDEALPKTNEGLYDATPCKCGSGLDSFWAFDARGIPLKRVCKKCRDEKLKGYRKDVLDNPNYDADEPIEPDELEEMTSTGAVAGYATPFAFSKNKKGSPKGIAAAKKYGKVVGETEKK